VSEWEQDTAKIQVEPIVEERNAKPPVGSNSNAQGRSHIPPLGEVPALTRRFTVFNLDLEPFYFIFTPECNFDQEGLCDDDNFGLKSLSLSELSFLPRSRVLDTGTPAFHVKESLNLEFDREDMKILRAQNLKDHELIMDAIKAKLPLAHMTLYCAPCIRAIRTALLTCARESSTFLGCLVRVDDRIPSSCCPEVRKLDRLVSLVSRVKEREAGTLQYLHENFKYLDRPWIEKRIYELEEELSTPGDPQTIFDRIKTFLEVISYGPSNRAVAILGEPNECAWILQTKPFEWKARMPKETEVYLLQLISYNEHKSVWDRELLGSFTPRNFKASTKRSSESVTSESSYTGQSNTSSPIRHPFAEPKRAKLSTASIVE
jgi:hypothetical protein